MRILRFRGDFPLACRSQNCPIKKAIPKEEQACCQIQQEIHRQITAPGFSGGALAPNTFTAANEERTASKLYRGSLGDIRKYGEKMGSANPFYFRIKELERPKAP